MFRYPMILLVAIAIALPAAEVDGRLEARLRAAAAVPTAAPAPAAVPVLAAPAAAPAALAAPVITGATVSMGDLGAAPQWERVELTLAIAHADAAAGLNPYEPDPARGGVDLGATFTGPDGRGEVAVHGFYDGSAWKVRFAPDTIGTWGITVRVETAAGSHAIDHLRLDCVEGPSQGFLRIDGRALRYAEGDRFFGVGYNTGWMYEVRIPDFATLGDRGGNLLSFWMGVPWAYPGWDSDDEPFWSARSALENGGGGVGFYQPQAGHYIDAVVADAEANGIHLIPSIWIHDQLRDESHGWPSPGNWLDNPYRNLFTDPAEWFTRTTAGGDDTEQWILQRNLLRYIIARWGSSSAIAAWVSLVEMDGTNGYEDDATGVVDWCAAVADYCATIDPYRTNASGDYPIVATISERTASSYDNGDLRAIDSYGERTDAIAVADYLSGQLAALRAGDEPAMIHEWGNDVAYGYRQPEHYHNGLWASAATGPLCTALLWCDGFNYPLPATPAYFPSSYVPRIEPAVLDQLEIMADFAAGTPVLGASENRVPESGVELDLGSGSVGVDAYAIRTDEAAVVWFHRPGGTITPGFDAWLDDLGPGLFLVEWFDPWTSGSEPILRSAREYTGSASLYVPAPSLDRPDIALRLRRYAAVNTAPSFSGGDVVVPADGGAVSLAWASAISAGSAVEDEVQTLSFQLGVEDPSLFNVPPTLAADGTLAFTPAGVPGTTTMTVVLRDDGGDAGGGADASSPQVFTIDLSGREVELTINQGGAGVADLEVVVDAAAASATTDADGRVEFDHLGDGDHRFHLGDLLLKSN